MNDEAILDWLTNASPSQFILGVIVLVFGTSKILSAENVEKSVGGLLLPVRWLHSRREKAAKEEISGIQKLKEDNLRLNKEMDRYHAWAILATKRNRRLEAFIVANNLEVPPPEFVYLHDFKLEEGEDEE